MKVQLLSDIHTEFHPDKGLSWIDGLDSNCDVLVVAGDLGSRFNIVNILLLLSKKFKEVVYVNGNHELYGTSFSEIELIRLRMKEVKNLHWLQNSFCEINGQRFVGSTMWFRDKPFNFRYQSQLTDFRLIDNFASKVYEENERSVKFLEENVKENDVVVTHHLPSDISVDERYKNNPINCFYVCDMSKLILDKNPSYWLHGHTHSSVNEMIGHTKIICNPFGYFGGGTNREFVNNLLFEVNMQNTSKQYNFQIHGENK